MPDEKLTEVPQQASASQAPRIAGRSRRIYHAPAFMVPNWKFLGDYLPYLASREYTDYLLTPPFTPTFENNGEKPGGSPYAFADAKMNYKYTDGKQLDLSETVDAVRDLISKADTYKINVFFDVALNHVGHKPNISKKNPVFRDLAYDIEQGKVTFDKVFCAPHEKRSPIAADWTDVREMRMETDEEVDNAIKYFAKPYLSYVATCARPKGKKTAVNVRLDAPHMLPDKFWKKFAPVMTDILSGENGEMPEILLETIDPLHHYNGIYTAFPEKARPHIRHMNYPSFFSITGDNSHPYHQLYSIQTNDRDSFWNGIHDKSLTQTSVALINCTHDMTDDNGATVKAHLQKFNLDKDDFVICRRLYNSVLQLSSPEIIRMHTDDGNDFHTQKNLFDCQPINPSDCTCEESYSFSKNLNITHKSLHDDKSYAWYEAAHVHEHKECLLHIARPMEGFGGNPTLTFVNASDNAVETKEGQDFLNLFQDAYRSKCLLDPKGLKTPQHINLLGKFTESQVDAIASAYGEVTVNGKPLKAAQNSPFSLAQVA